jgi:hypothetical protein
MDIKELESGVDPHTHWYYQSKKQPLLGVVSTLRNKSLHLIDVGAGSGFFSVALQQHFPTTFSHISLVDTAYTEDEMLTSNGETMQKQHKLPIHIEQSLVLMMDVLEHLENDSQLLAEIKAHAVADTNHFFITVPAFKSVWSAHDVYLGHYRRYTKSSLKKLLLDNGYTVDKIYYLYGTLFPLVFLKRTLFNFFASTNAPTQSDMKPLPSWLNALLLRYSSLEMLLTKYNRWFGLTCVAEGRL